VVGVRPRQVRGKGRDVRLLRDAGGVPQARPRGARVVRVGDGHGVRGDPARIPVALVPAVPRQPAADGWQHADARRARRQDAVPAAGRLRMQKLRRPMVLGDGQLVHAAGDAGLQVPARVGGLPGRRRQRRRHCPVGRVRSGVARGVLDVRRRNHWGDGGRLDAHPTGGGPARAGANGRAGSDGRAGGDGGAGGDDPTGGGHPPAGSDRRASGDRRAGGDRRARGYGNAVGPPLLRHAVPTPVRAGRARTHPYQRRRRIGRWWRQAQAGGRPVRQGGQEVRGAQGGHGANPVL